MGCGMHRHGRPGKMQQAGHLGTCLAVVISSMASGFVSSQITWISPPSCQPVCARHRTRPHFLVPQQAPCQCVAAPSFLERGVVSTPTCGQTQGRLQLHPLARVVPCQAGVQWEKAPQTVTSSVQPGDCASAVTDLFQHRIHPLNLLLPFATKPGKLEDTAFSQGPWDAPTSCLGLPCSRETA